VKNNRRKNELVTKALGKRHRENWKVKL